MTDSAVNDAEHRETEEESAHFLTQLAGVQKKYVQWHTYFHGGEGLAMFVPCV